jgi:alpha-D-xyloside xylohydrolase
MRKSTEVWSYGKAAEAIISKYLRLRYALMPYMYSLARRTYETGAPFMRALFMDFPDDPRVMNIGDEYMFGPALLVAPVTEQGVESRDVYLPEGSDWYNYWTNEKVAGGRTIRVTAPIDTIPVFVRAGSILPLGAPVQNTSVTQALAEVRVYAGRDVDFTLYDDDGISYDYEHGAGRKTLLHWDEAARVLKAHVGDKPIGSVSRLLRIID